MIPTITPLYGSFVLGIKDSLILSLFLVLLFISATIFIFIWQPVVTKLGPKKTFQIVLIVFILTLIPFMFISDMVSGFIAFFCLGIGIAGTFTVQNVCTSQIIDDDELTNGIRREAGFFGVEGFVVKLSTVVIFIAIALVFNSVGWAIFDPVGTSEETIFGLRSLMVIFPSIFLLIGLISMRFYPFTKERYEELTREIVKLHKEKKEKILG
jgi:GPH family glycoside/pentoside/hexuronide:cation symporter